MDVESQQVDLAASTVVLPSAAESEAAAPCTATETLIENKIDATEPSKTEADPMPTPDAVPAAENVQPVLEIAPIVGDVADEEKKMEETPTEDTKPVETEVETTTVDAPASKDSEEVYASESDTLEEVTIIQKKRKLEEDPAGAEENAKKKIKFEE